MKIKLLVVLVFIAISFNAKSQDYINSVGFRGGLSSGVSFKHFLSTTDAAEGILAMRWGGFNITGLYERHVDSFDVDRLFLYYGAGGHIGSWDNNLDGSADSFIGIDGIIGVEYVLREIPFNISLDWKPGLNFIGGPGFLSDELAISFRFMF
ncbi:MAG: hypothetical protein KAS71_02190 [Bacteroidales bacterium]|nr:hypothetical protein [Bacteroidales bacterium]